MVMVRDQFGKFSKHNPLIATTYNFDFQTIKETITPRGGTRERSIVITDKACFNSKESSSSFSNQGLSYFVYPAHNIKGSFHPKVTVGLDEGILKLLVGSHNLTEAGVKYNLEITSYYEIPLLETFTEIIQGISNFVKQITNCIQADITIKKTMQHLVECMQDLGSIEMVLKPQACIRFLHSFRKPIFEQVLEIVPNINHATVCAPFLSEDIEFITDIINSLGGKVTFLIDPKNFSISDEAKEVYEKHDVQILNIDNNRHLHAKFFVFHTQNGDWTLHGSPNFTRKALWQRIERGGNVEASILQPPSKKWSWKDLFRDRVTASPIQWSELHSIEKDEQEQIVKETQIERWGYETPNNEGVILAQGLADGTVVYIHLLGIDKNLKIKVKKGLIRFKIPSNWYEDTRYEILDKNLKVISSGFLNRSGSVMKELSGVDIDDAAKLNLWFYLRRLRHFDPKKIYTPPPVEIPEVPLDPKDWRPRPIPVDWRPISKRILMMTPKKIYDNATSTFEESWEEYYNEESEIPKDVMVRNLLVAMDIFVEGVFYSYLLSKENKYLVLLSRDMAEFLDLPCADDPYAQWNEDNWKKYFLSGLEKEDLDEWERYGNRLRLDVSLLFDFWLYLNSKSVGYQVFNRRSLDVPIVTNRYYQIFMALTMLIKPKMERASFHRVWDNRIGFLKTQKEIPLPSNLNNLKECLNHSYDLAKAKL